MGAAVGNFHNIVIFYCRTDLPQAFDKLPAMLRLDVMEALIADEVFDLIQPVQRCASLDQLVQNRLFMNIRWNIILGVIALALLGWYYSLNQDHSDLQSLIKKPDSPEYVGNKMETTVFSPEGKKQYLAISDKVEYYTQDGHTDFISPLVYLFDVPLDNKDKEANRNLKSICYNKDKEQKYIIKREKNLCGIQLCGRS